MAYMPIISEEKDLKKIITSAEKLAQFPTTEIVHDVGSEKISLVPFVKYNEKNMQFCVAVVTKSDRKYKSVGNVISFDDQEDGQPALRECSIQIDDSHHTALVKYEVSCMGVDTDCLVYIIS